MKNFELWMDSSGRIGEFLDAQPGVIKTGVRAWRTGGLVVRVFPMRRMGADETGPPWALVIRYDETEAREGQPILMGWLLKLLGR